MLNEPLSSARAVETLSGLLADGGMTVLLVEHDMEVVFSLANKITVLHPARSSPTAPRRRSRTMRRCSALSWASPDAEDGLAQRPYGPSHILQGVDLALAPRIIMSVPGRNGVGRTTTARAVMGLVAPASGRVQGGQLSGGEQQMLAIARALVQRFQGNTPR